MLGMPKSYLIRIPHSETTIRLLPLGIFSCKIKREQNQAHPPFLLMKNSLLSLSPSHFPDKTLSHAIRQGKNRKLLLQRRSRRFFSPVEYTRILIRWPAEIKMNYEEANPDFLPPDRPTTSQLLKPHFANHQRSKLWSVVDHSITT